MCSENHARRKADIHFRLFFQTNQTFFLTSRIVRSIFFLVKKVEENLNFMLDIVQRDKCGHKRGDTLEPCG
jgi:hypothetical protein